MEVIRNLEIKIEMMTKWLRHSGMTVNETKTEAWFFSENQLFLNCKNFTLKQVYQKKNMYDKFNCITVNFDETQHSIYVTEG